MKSRLTGMNRRGLSEAVKRHPERYDSTQTTFPEHMLLETRIGVNRLTDRRSRRSAAQGERAQQNIHRPALDIPLPIAYVAA